jgi:hypothetical protein
LQWQVVEVDPEALRRYKADRPSQPIPRAPKPERAAPDYISWPAIGDAYRLQIEGAGLAVTERETGASWHLTLGPVASGQAAR